jgi:hypothetical protein
MCYVLAGHSPSMQQQKQHQPAAELITNALNKIKKLAGHRKHADLVEQCQHLIDTIHEVSITHTRLRGCMKLPCKHFKGVDMGSQRSVETQFIMLLKASG